MTRFTSINLPRKAFVPSTAEESNEPRTSVAGQMFTTVDEPEKPSTTKRKRRGTRGKDPSARLQVQEQARKQGKSWSRDAGIASTIMAQWYDQEADELLERTKFSAEHSESRRIKGISEKYAGTTCFACRSVGHAARECPNVLLAAVVGEGSSTDRLEDPAIKTVKAPGAKGMKRKSGKKGGDVTGGQCYRCNAKNHSLSLCPEPIDPSNPTPFATCFICLGTSHLSSLCPSNPGRGIYVNGGNCKLCGSTAHRAKDCAKNIGHVEQDVKRPEKRRAELVIGSGERAGADEDDFLVTSREETKTVLGEKVGKGKKRKLPPAKNGERPAAGRAVEGESGAVRTDSQVVGMATVAPTPPVTKTAGPKSKPKIVTF